MYGPIDTQHELRNAAIGVVTATTAEAGIAFAATMAGDFRAVFAVSGLDETTGDETYRLAIETDSTTAFASPTEIAAVTVMAAGLFELPLSQGQVGRLDAGAAAIRCKATLGGTTPSLVYGCWLVPVP
jgi:hypothetical protein